MSSCRVSLTEYELVELLELLSNRIQYQEDLIPLYQKLLNKQPQIDYSKVDLDYEIPSYEGRK
tara:strand:- start:4704 stop:4892 length:189 start_codon:yes stop_codon:yes gene_type:complete